MLRELSFSNFKSWRRLNVACGKITGIFGTNSSGKTSILQFLLLLKQTKEATDRRISLQLNGELVSLGTIRDAIHNHEENRTIDFAIAFSLDNELALLNPDSKRISDLARSKNLRLEASLGIQKQEPIARRLSYVFDDVSFTLAPKRQNSSEFDLKATPTREGSNFSYRFRRTQGRPWQLPGPVKSYGFPDQARTYFQNAGFLADLEVAYEAQIDKVFYLGPLRDFPQRDYLWARSRPTDVGRRGEKAIDAILAATDDGETRNLRYRSPRVPFQKMIAQLLRDIGVIYDFKMEEIARGSSRWQAKVRTSPLSSEVLLTDVGFGVSQILPVITLLQYVPEGSTVILEQPEIHLHPLAQAGLADIIIQAAVHRRVQIILESHSEHLLLRLQRRIAEEIIKSEDVKLYFCNAPRGYSRLTELEVDLLGNIRNWPDKFMGDSFNEAAHAQMARLRRMRNAHE